METLDGLTLATGTIGLAASTAIATTWISMWWSARRKNHRDEAYKAVMSMVADYLTATDNGDTAAADQALAVLRDNNIQIIDNRNEDQDG